MIKYGMLMECATPGSCANAKTVNGQNAQSPNAKAHKLGVCDIYNDVGRACANTERVNMCRLSTTFALNMIVRPHIKLL